VVEWIEFVTAEAQVRPEGGKVLEVLRGNRPGVLIFGIPVLAGSLLFIWRDGNLGAESCHGSSEESRPLCSS
jgi:hypothetical protein